MIGVLPCPETAAHAVGGGLHVLVMADGQSLEFTVGLLQKE